MSYGSRKLLKGDDSLSLNTIENLEAYRQAGSLLLLEAHLKGRLGVPVISFLTNFLTI